MSPSTLSRQIQRMEEELEQSLFIRDNRQVRLTEQGERLDVYKRQPLVLKLDDKLNYVEHYYL